MQTENADFEVLSGCLGILGLLFFGGGGLVGRLLWTKRARPVHNQLVRLVTEFVTGQDRSLEQAARIESLLTTTLARDRQYAELTEAVTGFAPTEAAAFRDEAGLLRVFRAFLKNQGVVIPEEAPRQAGVWPPAPKR